MTERDQIHAYLKTLSTYLSRLEKADADEVIREIESHIYDALETQTETTNLETILDGFGSPRDLAASYVEHILNGTPPPAGFKAIQTVKKGATKSLYYTTACFGYIISAALLFLAIYKLFDPNAVGLWSNGNGESVIIGVVDGEPEGKVDILDWWLIPVFISISVSILYVTRRLLTILKAAI